MAEARDGHGPTPVSRRATTIATVLVATVGCAVFCLQLRDVRIEDPFHYGEYFAYFTSVRLGTFSGHALSLHGALEYAPAWLARALAGRDHYFFGTMIVLAAAGVVAVLLFGLVAAALLDDSPRRYPLLPAVVLLALLTTSGREVFLLLSMWLAIRIFEGRDTDRSRRIACEVALGVATAIGLLWSFDRGLAHLAAIGMPAMLVLARRPSFRLAAAVWVVTLIVLGMTTDVFSLVGYVENIRFVIDVSGQFSYGWLRSAMALKLAGLVITLAAMSMLFLVARARRRPSDGHIALMLAFLCAVLLRAVSYRADPEHFPAMLWAPALALIFAGERLQGTPYRTRFDLAVVVVGAVGAVLAIEFGPHGRTIFLSTALFAVVLLLAHADRAVVRRQPALVHAAMAIPVVTLAVYFVGALQSGGFGWISRVGTPPTNVAIATAEVDEAARALARHRVGCVMDLSNRGVINGLLDLPSCTRFTYPLYATPKYEDEMIESLVASGVGAVLYSSTAWSYRIDGQSMATRLPRLDAFLRTRFPVLDCDPTHCIRSRP